MLLTAWTLKWRFVSLTKSKEYFKFFCLKRTVLSRLTTPARPWGGVKVGSGFGQWKGAGWVMSKTNGHEMGNHIKRKNRRCLGECIIGEKSSLPIFLLRNLVVYCQNVTCLLFWNATSSVKFYSGLQNGHIKFFYFYTKFSHIKWKITKYQGKKYGK